MKKQDVKSTVSLKIPIKHILIACTYMLPHNSYSVLDENNLEDAKGWFGTQIQYGINKF